jgi:hypothetical protein
LTHQQAFLKAFEESCCVRWAARAAQIAPRTHYRWLRRDASYAANFAESKCVAADLLESVAVERAVHGIAEPVFYQGVKCGTITRYSDGLLMQLLRAFKPERYNVQRQEVSARQLPPVQSNVQVTFVYPDGRKADL